MASQTKALNLRSDSHIFRPLPVAKLRRPVAKLKPPKRFSSKAASTSVSVRSPTSEFGA